MGRFHQSKSAAASALGLHHQLAATGFGAAGLGNANAATGDGATLGNANIATGLGTFALALADPILADDQRFGMKVNWGGFDGANAVGVTASGVLGKDLLTKVDRFMLLGGAGWGQSSVNDYSERVVGGHAGVQFAW
jgi:hypothetical protein